MSLWVKAAAGIIVLAGSLPPDAFADSSRQASGRGSSASAGHTDRAAAIASLQRDITRWIEGGVLADSRIGVHVVSLVTDEDIFSDGADRLLNPASNIKLATAAAALEILGPEYSFKTEIWVDQPPDEEGIVDGNIYVKGFGDPSFVTERMVRLVLDLWNLGVRRITGDIVIDETFFDSEREGPGWEQETSDRAYIAPAGAVSLNRNAVSIHVRAGRTAGARAEITLDPDSGYFILDNRVTTGARRSRRGQRPSSIAEGNRQRILVRGVHPINARPRTHWRRIDSPPHYFAETFRTFMFRQGVRFNRRRVRIARVPDRAVLLHTAYSASLADVLGPLNKFSNNHVAEMLVKTMGAETRGIPGSWEKGSEAVGDFLAGVGIERGSYVYRNGSGLNDVNRVSARQMTTLLAYSWCRFQMSPEFVASLPVSGRDGTTRWRMEDSLGFVRAKTGTLENVSALSGYVGTPAGEILAFSVIVNDHPGPLREVIAGIDGVPTRLVRFGGATGERITGSSPAPLFDTVTGLNERSALYLALFSAMDERNVGLLLRAYDGEEDPLLRALIADAAHRSSAEVDPSLLLQTFIPSPESLGRLLRLAGGLSEPVPVLSSLANLAADGDRLAIRSMIAAAHSAIGMEPLDEWFAETLSEIGRAAPEDLLAVLVELDSSPGGERALRLIADGLRVDSEEPAVPGRHPFREALSAAGRIRARAAAADTNEDSAASVIGERIENMIQGLNQEETGGEESSLPEGDDEGGMRNRAGPASPTASASPEGEVDDG